MNVITGSCFCGTVTFLVDEPLANARCCHCSRCRKAFSGAGSAYAEVRPGSFRVTSGENHVAGHVIDADWSLCFCRTCGSTLFAKHGDSVHGVTLGSLDGDPGVEIAVHQFVGSRAPWDHIGGTAPQYDEHPPQAKAGNRERGPQSGQPSNA